MKRLLQIVLVSSLFLLGNSCYYDELVAERIIPDISDDVEVSFINDIEPLFSQKDKDCTACHNGNIANPDLTEGNAYNSLVPDYVQAGDADNSKLFLNAPGNNHPIDAGFTLSANELALIKTWINRGADNN